MSAIPIPATNTERPPASSSGRLVSLDAYRGLIMCILVSNGLGLAALQSYPGWRWLADQVEHSEWTGITFWDLIQPAFTFMVGVAMPFAIASRRAKGASTADLFRHVCSRAVVLVLLSNLFSSFGSDEPIRLQLINVLSQIAFGYVLCFLILQVRFEWQVACAVMLLAVQWLLFVVFPGPNGAFSQVGNIGQEIDRAMLGYTYSGYYVTINFIGNAVTILFGCWAGLLLRSGRSQRSILTILAASVAVAALTGLALEPFNPDVKRLWTASFTFLSASWVIAILLAVYWVVEVRGWRRWTFPFIVVGMNSIFIYSFWQLLGGWLDTGLAAYTKRFVALGPAGEIPHRLAVLAVMWGLCYWLYRRRIFFKA